MKKDRNQVMVKNEFQKELIMSTLLITLITLNVIIMLAFTLDSAFGSKQAMFSVFNVSVGVLELVAVVIVYFVGRKISFHIAGPVYAIERTLKQMEEGNLAQTLKLRPGDHFEEVADALNITIECYKERLIHAQELAQDLNDSPKGRELTETLAWFKTRPDEKEES